MLFSRSLSVQSKLIVAFVLLTLVTIGVVSWIGYVSARESLRAASERELMGLQRSKNAVVQSILRSARNEVLSLSASSTTTNAARELLAAYRQVARQPVRAEMQAEVRRFYQEEFVPALAKRSAIAPPADSLLPTTSIGWYLHYHYIATGPKPYGTRRTNRSATDKSAYGQAVAHVLPELEGAINRLEQGNLTLVDPETLEVFFSLEQSSVLGTSLLDGPYAASKMAKLVLSLPNSQNVDDYRVADFYSFVWGREIEGAIAALGVTSIVVGLALKEPLGNSFSGLMLLMERPFEVGDTIEVGTMAGEVKEVNWRSAHIEALGGAIQVVPNSTLNKETIVNFSRPRPIRMELVDVSFSYEAPPYRVREALVELLLQTEGVLKSPKPIAATLGYGDSRINYRLIFDKGDVLDGVYFVVSGAVSLQVIKDGQASEIATIQAGEFCGETGDARPSGR